ncbi:thiazolylpeptide-type bacteriocin [Tumebacillus sp. ITR2]|uniref:Thiazolylpeptide-type bacteriocin n=1 Tax=Tumebacillus amylolyticus TaxID=2801339 RepID=A0ABS1J9S2_9BACL|nr:thiazolylpeptide-type bacteriocin [Tumebacillus amylolyticus]MBL0386970.1 thiazolylpeptide-type bacteriocin [Tumebacillus amylolyticus]MBL0386973.1 thiazolylpeptide-type bacteriocin [Tumebacillus amylolyticus]
MEKFKGLEVTGLEVMDLNDAMALPETAASSGSSSSNTCSTCGSSSCCALEESM